MSFPKYLECNLCGNQQPYEPFAPAICKKCDSQWLEARYDYDAFKRELLRGLPNRPTNMWRYQDILPLRDSSALDLYPAGGTPLWLSQRFARGLGHDSVYIKDERYGPTSSFKDRQAAGAVAAMLENGIKEAVIASTGNAAVAYAAACARACEAGQASDAGRARRGGGGRPARTHGGGGGACDESWQRLSWVER